MITLKGDNPLTLVVGDTYEDPGATATDDVDGDLTAAIQTEGSVETTSVGDYTVTYSVSDTAGNNATATRTVTVIEVPIRIIIGTVTDPAGNGLQGARVQVAGTGEEVETDSGGAYRLELQEEPEAGASLVVTLDGYTEQGRKIDDVGDIADFTLAPVDRKETQAADIPARIDVKGAKVTIPANAYTQADGQPYTGKVTLEVSYNKVTTQIGAAAFPGDYEGESASGQTLALKSYGYIEVKLTDEQGQDVKLANGQQATLTFPLDEKIGGEPPAVIPLWYYDRAKGIWVEEGKATYDAASKTYSGSVGHFTTWNLDIAIANTGDLTGCVEDANGQRVTDAYILLRGTGWSAERKIHDGQGNFTFLNVPAGEALTLTAKTAGAVSVPRAISLSTGEERTLGGCLVVKADNIAPKVTVTGRVVDAFSGAPLNTGGVVRVSNVQGNALGEGTIGGDGGFSVEIDRPSGPVVVETTIGGHRVSRTVEVWAGDRELAVLLAYGDTTSNSDRARFVRYLEGKGCFVGHYIEGSGEEGYISYDVPADDIPIWATNDESTGTYFGERLVLGPSRSDCGEGCVASGTERFSLDINCNEKGMNDEDLRIFAAIEGIYAGRAFSGFESGPVEVWLRGGDITDISPLKNLLTPAPSLGGDGDKVTSLDLSNNQIRDLGQFNRIGYPARDLSLNGNPIEDLSPLGNIPSDVQYLDIRLDPESGLDPESRQYKKYPAPDSPLCKEGPPHVTINGQSPQDSGICDGYLGGV